MKKKELPESAPAYQKTMFEALFRDGAEEVYTQKLPEGFEKYLRKALKELEKIVMIRQLDGVYRLDHAVTATQKTILDAFGLNEGNVRYQAKEIGNILQNQ